MDGLYVQETTMENRQFSNMTAIADYEAIQVVAINNLRDSGQPTPKLNEHNDRTLITSPEHFQHDSEWGFRDSKPTRWILRIIPIFQPNMQ